LIHISMIRAVRDGLLEDTDVWTWPDRNLTQEQIDELYTYRQELRDLTDTLPFVDLMIAPDAIAYPVKPEWMV